MIYLDHNATTPVLPEAFEAMCPYFCDAWGNPSSSYRFGAKLKTAIETARAQIAQLIGSHPGEIIFTSGGTESDNTGIRSMIHANEKKRHFVTSAVEHSAVLSVCRRLEETGFRITYLPVSREGLLSMADLEAALSDETAGVSLMWANNETGVLFPVAEIASLCNKHGIPFHCDAVQAAGKIKIDVRKVPVDYLALAGHKIGAPKGIGALYVRRKASFTPLVEGGHQERGRRGGTENVPLNVAFGIAAAKADKELTGYEHTVRPLRDTLENGLLEILPGTERNGDHDLRVANTTNVHFPNVQSEALLMLLDQAGICASSGSACLADSPEPSHVLAAMKPGPTAHESIRFSLGMTNNDREIQQTIQEVRNAVTSLASVSGF